MGEIIPGVDPREKMAGDYWTKGVRFKTAPKWQAVCFFLSRAGFTKCVRDNVFFFDRYINTNYYMVLYI